MQISNVYQALRVGPAGEIAKVNEPRTRTQAAAGFGNGQYTSRSAIEAVVNITRGADGIADAWYLRLWRCDSQF